MTDTMTDQLKQLSEAATEEAKFLIQKSGAYYRPNSRGYTNSAIQAGRYTLNEAISITHPNGPAGPRDNMRFFHEDDVVCEDWKAYRALKSQLTEAKAREAVAYEVAAKACWKQAAYRTEQLNLNVSDIQRARWIAGAKQAEMMAQAIEDMRPTHTTTALEQIKQQARDEEREAMNHMAETLKEAVHSYNQWMLDDDYNAGPVLDRTISHIKSALATLSDTPE